MPGLGLTLCIYLTLLCNSSCTLHWRREGSFNDLRSDHMEPKVQHLGFLVYKMREPRWLSWGIEMLTLYSKGEHLGSLGCKVQDLGTLVCKTRELRYCPFDPRVYISVPQGQHFDSLVLQMREPRCCTLGSLRLDLNMLPILICRAKGRRQSNVNTEKLLFIFEKIFSYIYMFKWQI